MTKQAFRESRSFVWRGHAANRIGQCDRTQLEGILSHLALIGTVTEIITTNPPARPPIISSLSLTDGSFKFTVTGSGDTNYVVQTTTNLAAPDWQSLVTNAAPFTFIHFDADSSPHRFYRAILAP